MLHSLSGRDDVNPNLALSTIFRYEPDMSEIRGTPFMDIRALHISLVLIPVNFELGLRSPLPP
jgi:hypothetical protein